MKNVKVKVVRSFLEFKSENEKSEMWNATRSLQKFRVISLTF